MLKTVPVVINCEGKPFNTVVTNRCPYCGIVMAPTLRQTSECAYNGCTVVVLAVFHVHCCDKLFFATYIKQATKMNIYILKLLYVYPQTVPEPLPEQVVSLSPRFAELHSQAVFAEQHSFYELAGSGYRNALEVLIKDFAIKELGEPESNCLSKSLSQAIKEYTPNTVLTISADVVRIIGNDYTHFEKKLSHIEFDTFKRYMAIFIHALDCQLAINHPPISRN